MTDKVQTQAQIASRWPDFYKLWRLVALVLFVLLLLLWLLGYGPGGGNCQTPVEQSVSEVATSDDVDKLTEVEKAVVVEADAAVVDALAPVVQLIGPETVRLAIGAGFNDQGASAVDDIDGRLSVVMSGNVDTSNAGEYVLGYTATDQAGNVGRASRTVIVEVAASEEQASATEMPDTARLYFGVGSSEFPSDPKLSLADTISYIRNHPESKAIVAGYHDPSGDLATNQRLSRDRALAVSKLLQDAGISESRILLEEPVETTGTGAPEEARRVEVRVSN